MEKSIDRLTRKIRYGQGEFAKMRACIAGEEGCTRYPKSCAECDDNKAVIDRLAAYEDILYTPSGKELITIDRLRDLAQADKDGRCVVLPCRVGDTVWIISGGEAIECILDDAMRFKAAKYNLEIIRHFDGKVGEMQTVFLTRAEAEAALEREG